MTSNVVYLVVLDYSSAKDASSRPIVFPALRPSSLTEPTAAKSRATICAVKVSTFVTRL